MKLDIVLYEGETPAALVAWLREKFGVEARAEEGEGLMFPLIMVDGTDEQVAAVQAWHEAAHTVELQRGWCRCGYAATGQQDMDDHIAAMMGVNDGSDHG